eukprot:403331054
MRQSINFSQQQAQGNFTNINNSALNFQSPTRIIKFKPVQEQIFKALREKKEETVYPRKGYIQEQDLLQLQKVKDYVFREYDLDKLKRNCVETKLKKCMDFYDTNLQDSMQNIQRWKKEQAKLMAIKSSVQVLPLVREMRQSQTVLKNSHIQELSNFSGNNQMKLLKLDVQSLSNIGTGTHAGHTFSNGNDIRYKSPSQLLSSRMDADFNDFFVSFQSSQVSIPHQIQNGIGHKSLLDHQNNIQALSQQSNQNLEKNLSNQNSQLLSYRSNANSSQQNSSNNINNLRMKWSYPDHKQFMHSQFSKFSPNLKYINDDPHNLSFLNPAQQMNNTGGLNHFNKRYKDRYQRNFRSHNISPEALKELSPQTGKIRLDLSQDYKHSRQTKVQNVIKNNCILLDQSLKLNNKYQVSEQNKLIVLDERDLYPIKHQIIKMPVSSGFKTYKLKKIHLNNQIHIENVNEGPEQNL